MNPYKFETKSDIDDWHDFACIGALKGYSAIKNFQDNPRRGRLNLTYETDSERVKAVLNRSKWQVTAFRHTVTVIRRNVLDAIEPDYPLDERDGSVFRKMGIIPNPFETSGQVEEWYVLTAEGISRAYTTLLEANSGEEKLLQLESALELAGSTRDMIYESRNRRPRKLAYTPEYLTIGTELDETFVEVK